MASRLELHSKLKELLGSENVYYQPPNNLLIKYPAIKYSKSDINLKFADNTPYARMTRYDLIVIDYEPDNEVVDSLLQLPYCSYDRHYIADNLDHDVLIIYW